MTTELQVVKIHTVSGFSNPTVEETQSSVNTNVPNESFYLDRFKRCVEDRNYVNGRLIDEDYNCEIYKGFAIVTWKQEWQQPNNKTRISFNSYVWQVGGVFDELTNLAWLGQGVISTGHGATTYERAIKKIRKRVDLLSEVYAHKEELRALSISYRGRIANANPLYNALIGDVVAIRAFGRTRLGKIVKLVGSRFVVAYMTPSNAQDVHYKTLPLSQIYPKD